MKNKHYFDFNELNNFSFLGLVLATFIPGLIAYIGFHFIIPKLVTNNIPILLAYGITASSMLFLFLLFAVAILFKESKELGISVLERMLIKKISRKNILISILVFILVTTASIMATSLSSFIIKIFNINIPNYLTYLLNPTIDLSSADPMVITSGINLSGRWDILFFLILTIILNILTEEIYFRAWMLPKLTKFGKYSWILNGFMFALYHIYQLWLFPVILVASLGFAYICNRCKSIIPAFVLHLVMNALTIAGLLSIFF